MFHFMTSLISWLVLTFFPSFHSPQATLSNSQSSSITNNHSSSINTSETITTTKPEKPLEFLVLPTYEIPKIIIEKDSYVQSFDIDTDSSEEILQFFNSFGFVVFRDVISPKQIQNSLEEIWHILEHDFELSPHDPTSWKRTSQMGILGNGVCWKKQAMENRQNEKIVQCFELLYGMGRDQLWSGFSRYGCMQPTRGIPVPYYNEHSFPKSILETVPSSILSMVGSLKTIDREDLQTRSEWLHWDLNPFASAGLDDYPVEFENEIDMKETLLRNPDYYFILENNANTTVPRMQGILSFTDCREQDGGFVCVPGFHNHIKEYAEKMRHQLEVPTHCTFFQVPKGDSLFEQCQQVPVKAGSLIIFNSLLPHANMPNRSERFRLNQYIKMVPKKGSLDFKLARALIIDTMKDKSFVPSETGNTIFGLDLLYGMND